MHDCIFCTVATIGGSAFNGCGELVHITLPSGLTELKGYLFMYCKKLQEISKDTAYTYEELDALYSAVKGE